MKDEVFLKIIPFREDTPRFLTKKYYKDLKNIKNQNFHFVIFPFYVFNFYRNELNALILEKGEVKTVFGESFSKKSANFTFLNQNVEILFFFQAFLPNFKRKMKENDNIIVLDNEKLCGDYEFQRKKFKEQVIFIGKNGEVLCGKHFAKCLMWEKDKNK